MTWQLSGDLDAIRASIWAHFSDHVTVGTIGDSAHQGTASDHNPDSRGIVCAIDVMYPVGPKASAVVRACIGRWDLAYVIHNKTIWSATHGWSARAYLGSDPHTGHVHISSLHTDAVNQYHVGLDFGGTPSPTPTPPPSTTAGGAPPFRRLVQLTSPMMVGADVRAWQAKMSARGWHITVDGVFGPASQSTLEAFQREKGLTVDGKLGPVSWAATWSAPVT